MRHRMEKVAKKSLMKKGTTSRIMSRTGPAEPSDFKRAGSTMDRSQRKRREKRLAGRLL
jgi:hypothetical protein